MKNVAMGIVCAVLIAVGLSGVVSIAADYTPVSQESAITFKGAVTISNASVILSALPTATTGLSTGALWDSSGTVKIVQ